MLLAVDVGNSATVLGVFDGQRLVHSWRLQTSRNATADEVGAVLGQLCVQRGLAPTCLDAMAVASVVPPLRAVWRDVATEVLGSEPLLVDAATDVGLQLEVDHPPEVGADRIVDGLAAWKLHGAPVIVVDCGTATTVDGIGAGGRYLGGAIAPGIGIAAEALFQRAALLYRVELRDPGVALAKNTATQMQAGILYGAAAQIDGLVDRVRGEMGGADRVVATGGLAHLVAPLSRTITSVDPVLTLQGLRLAYNGARGRSPG